MSDETIDAPPPHSSLFGMGKGRAALRQFFKRLFSRKSPPDQFSQPTPPPSFQKSLRDGFIYGAIFMMLLGVWVALRSSDTAEKLQTLIPAKTAPIEVAQTSLDPNVPKDGLVNSKNIAALPPAPIEGLYEKFEGKMLPVTRIGDDLSPFQAYKKPFQLVAGKPLVSIVIVDYGLSPHMSQSMLDNLSPDISLVLTPYAQDAVKWAAAARAYGHEFWLSLPMQTKTFGLDDTGPQTLLLNTSTQEIQKRLFSVLASVAGYAGLVSQEDHAFTNTDKDVQPVMKQVFGRGLAFVESNPAIPAYGLSMAMEFGYPYAQNGAWLDEDLRPDAIDRALQDLELQATRKGRAIAFIHPYPLAINKVQTWITEAQARGIQIVPLSALVQ